MFEIIRPGMPMADVDRLCHRYCGGLLREIGLLGEDEAPEKYMWHGGAHHVGWDVHDQVDMTMPVSAGMVFCVDVGIYVEEWGIGFRLEDNCLVRISLPPSPGALRTLRLSWPPAEPDIFIDGPAAGCYNVGCRPVRAESLCVK